MEGIITEKLAKIQTKENVKKFESKDIPNNQQFFNNLKQCLDGRGKLKKTVIFDDVYGEYVAKFNYLQNIEYKRPVTVN